MGPLSSMLTLPRGPRFASFKSWCMHTMPPIIETARLRLRGHRYGDLQACTAMWADPIVTQYIGGKPSTETQTWARLQAYVGHWAMLGFGYWLIETKDGHEFVGEVGLADFKRDIAASMKRDPEIGYALASAFHGQGIATESVRAVLSWADENLPTSRTVCLINPQNVASQKVAEKCGYRGIRGGELQRQVHPIPRTGESYVRSPWLGSEDRELLAYFRRLKWPHSRRRSRSS